MARKLLPLASRMEEDRPRPKEVYRRLLLLNMKYLRMQREMKYIVQQINKLVSAFQKDQQVVAGLAGGLEVVSIRLRKHLVDIGEMPPDDTIPTIQ